MGSLFFFGGGCVFVFGGWGFGGDCFDLCWLWWVFFVCVLHCCFLVFSKISFLSLLGPAL